MTIVKITETDLNEGQQCLYRLLEQHRNRSQASEDHGKFRYQEKGSAVPKQEWQVGQTYKVRLEGMNKDGLFLVKSMKNKIHHENLKAALKKLDHENLKLVALSDVNAESERNKVYLCKTRQTFVRGKVIKVYPNLGFCSIRDIDECKSYLVRSESVFGLLPEYCELPPRVAECLLKGVNSKTLAFRPAINNVMSLIHGNMLMTIVTEEKNRPALVEMALPSGLNLSDLIVWNIHQNVPKLPLCENMDSVFSECSRIVDMQRFIMPALRNEKSDDEALKNIEGQVHVDIELFFRKAAEAGGFVYPLSDLYDAIYGITRRHIPIRKLGYRSWYSLLYTYNHLFQLKTFSSDHLGRIFIHIEDINGSDVDDGFTGVESFVQLKPEILLTMDNPLQPLNTAEMQSTSTSNSRHVIRTPTLESQFVVHNSEAKSNRARARGKPLNIDVHRRDSEYIEKIAKMIPFQPERPPAQISDSLALYSVPGEGYYLFYPADDFVMSNLQNLVEQPPTQDSGLIKIEETAENQVEETSTIGVENINSPNKKLLGVNMYSEAGMELDAILVGMDNNGFVHFSVNDPEVERMYSSMLQELQECYASESTRLELQLPRSGIQVGITAVGKVGGQYRRVRIYQHLTSRQSCWVVDLESREFHSVLESDLFRLTSKVTELPPKAHPGILTGIENFLMTQILPTLLGRVEMEKAEIRVRIIEPFHEHLQIPVVQVKVQGKDLSEMLLDACMEKDSLLGRKGPEWDSVKTFLRLYLLGHD